LPRDAALVELRADALTFRTRECVLPGAVVPFQLLLEGRPLHLSAPVEACLVMDRDKAGYVFHVRLALSALAEADRQLVALFILKGRGSPGLEPRA
jgi:hypothetical protein